MPELLDSKPNTLYLNGINGATGQYQPPMSFNQVRDVALGEILNDPLLLELKEKKKSKEPDFHVIAGIDAKNLAEAGWGVIFAGNPDAAILEALQPLLELREEQASAGKEPRFKKYFGEKGYLPNESKLDFLGKNGAGPGSVDPSKVPYYLLLVGDPEAIPFTFQYQLDVQYAVGRIHFDSPEEYRRYADHVVNAEKGRIGLGRRAAFWAPSFDIMTRLSANLLAGPLAKFVAEDRTAEDQPPGWKVQSFLKLEATKARLAALISGGEPPALLFAATHGVFWDRAHANQLPHMGALVCQDAPVPLPPGPVRQDWYFAGDDIPSNAKLDGMIASFFACYGGGTPQFDDFVSDPAKSVQLAEQPFIARLPQRMLLQGAQAVLAHVDRAWSLSFHWTGAGTQTQTYQSTIKELMDGKPIGLAMEHMNVRYAELSSDLNEKDQRHGPLERLRNGQRPDEEFAGIWTACHDARNYTVLGDPAVRLALKETPRMQEQPVITVSTQSSTVLRDESVPEPVSYGWFGSQSEAPSGFGAMLQQIAVRFGESLSRTVDGLANLEVTTYVSDNMNEVRFEDGKITGAGLRAVTRMGLDGRTMVCVPQSEGKVDEALWKLHMEAVEKAMMHRAEMAKLAASAISGLLGGWKLK